MWQSNFRCPTPPTRHCPCDCVFSMVRIPIHRAMPNHRRFTGNSGAPSRRRSASRGDARTRILCPSPKRNATSRPDPTARRTIETTPICFVGLDAPEKRDSDIEATDKPADPRAGRPTRRAARPRDYETTAHAATFKRAKVNGALLMRIDARTSKKLQNRQGLG